MSFFVLNNNVTTKMSKKVILHEEPFLNPPEAVTGNGKLDVCLRTQRMVGAVLIRNRKTMNV